MEKIKELKVKNKNCVNQVVSLEKQIKQEKERVRQYSQALEDLKKEKNETKVHVPILN